jgi:hypothetical protein
MTKYKPNERGIRQVSSPTAIKVLGTVPIQCPECGLAAQEADRKEKELLAQNEAALIAHKEHGKFLQTQLANSAGHPALNEVFKKLFEDCLFLQARKVVEILLAQDKDFSKPAFDRVRLIQIAVEKLKILESAAEIQWKRNSAQSGPASIENTRLFEELDSWISLNHSISKGSPNADYEVEKGAPFYNYYVVEASRCWKTAVNLAKGMKPDT